MGRIQNRIGSNERSPGAPRWYFGIWHVWTSEEAWWPGNRGSGVMAHGEAAKALAVLYMSVSAFVHTRWCWGLLGYNRMFETGTVISILGILGSMIWAFCTV